MFPNLYTATNHFIKKNQYTKPLPKMIFFPIAHIALTADCVTLELLLLGMLPV